MTRRIHRRRLSLALGASLLAHCAVLLWVSIGGSAPRRSAAAAPIELEWVELWTPAPPAAAPPAEVRPPPKATSRRPMAVAKKATASSTISTESADSLVDAPPESDVPRRRSLSPGPLTGPWAETVAEEHGHTLTPDDPRFRPDALNAEAEHRVTGRAHGILADELAEARAQRGLPHPYLSRLRSTLRSQLDSEARAQGLKPGPDQLLGALGRNYLGGTESYGRTGNPNLGPPGAAPRLSEKLKERFGEDPAVAPLRALIAATETNQDLRHARPTLSLTLELRLGSGGDTPARATLLTGSGDSRFDAFVLELAPKALATTGPPPPDATRGGEFRSQWAIEGWAKIPEDLERLLEVIPGAYGIRPDLAYETLTKGNIRYDFRARLLRVY